MNTPDVIQNIPLDKLVKSPRNVRRTPPLKAAEAELKASITVHSLQQNLVVAPANSDGVHEVIVGGLSLRRARVVDAERFEVAGFSAGAVDQLKALGLMSEIITWRLRLFIPTTDAGVAVLGALLDRHPVLHCTARARA